MKAGNKDILSGAILFALSVAVFVVGMGIKPILPIGVGSGFVPQVVAVMLGCLALVIMFNGAKAARADGQPTASLTGEQIRVVAITFVLIGAYVALIEPAGFLVSTFVYLFCQFLMLAPKSQRHWLRFAVIAAVTTVTIYYAFVYFFDLILPVGILG